ncbi:MAG: tyrosine-type recombinase/integrase [Chloroflexi bacterium]|nr:tyrosine-type recombinase/integrase [Chloroflexota bacterium]
MNTIPSLLAAYREYLEHERQLAKATVTAYLSDLRTLDAFAPKPVEDMTVDDLRAFMRHMSKNGLKTATIHRKIGGFSTFWKWLKLQHVVTENITERLTLPKMQQRVPVWLSHDELRRFVMTPAPGSTKWVRWRNGMAWKTLAWFGVRRDELRKLRVGDVHLVDRVLIVRETKGKRDRVLPIPQKFFDELAAWVAERPADQYLFPSTGGDYWRKEFFYPAFYAHLEACGLSGKGITPHALRHTFAIHLRLRGVSIEVLKELMGHKDIKTTLKYLQFGPEQFQEAMELHILNSFGAKAENESDPSEAEV